MEGGSDPGKAGNGHPMVSKEICFALDAAFKTKRRGTSVKWKGNPRSGPQNGQCESDLGAQRVYLDKISTIHNTINTY